jgi:Ca2+-binding RTX toxin-like protein
VTSIPALNGGSAALSILRALDKSPVQGAQTSSLSVGNNLVRPGDLRDPTMVAMGEINRILMENGGQLIHAGAFSTVHGTEYGDYIETGPGSSVRGGAGNDTIYAQHHSTVNGGAGNDTINVSGYSKAYGGEGDDYIVGSGRGTVLSGGAGNDRIFASRGTEVVEGNAGNDYLTAGYGTAIINGGRGDDTISLVNHKDHADDTVIRYNSGDGSDTINLLNSRAQLEFGEGISAEDVTISRDGNTATVSFTGSDDELTMRMGEYGGFEGTGLTLSFADGSTREIGGDINPSKVVAMYSPQTGFVRFDQD